LLRQAGSYLYLRPLLPWSVGVCDQRLQIHKTLQHNVDHISSDFMIFTARNRTSSTC
jgi:hypothetical protein